MKPIGLPLLSRRVRLPLGVVLCWLARLAGGTKEPPLTVEAVSVEDMVLAGVNVRPLISVLTLPGLGCFPIDVVELIDDFFEGGATGSARDTIFIPTPRWLEAGMKSVVCPFFRAICVRMGWYAAQHPVSCVPVEYSWRASARDVWSSTMSSRVSSRRRARTSESVRTVRGIVDPGGR